MSMPPVYLSEEERKTVENFAKNGTHTRIKAPLSHY